MRYVKWLIVFILVFVAAFLLKPREELQDPSQEPGETLVSKSSLNSDGGGPTVGPYFSKKGAGIKFTIPF